MSCGVGSSPAKAVALHSDCNENYLVISYLIAFNTVANSPHYEDGKSDKYEEGATDADHRKCPEVDLTIAFGIREKLMISKSID